MEVVSIAALWVSGGWRPLKSERHIGEFDYRVDAEEACLAQTRQSHCPGRHFELLRQPDSSN